MNGKIILIVMILSAAIIGGGCSITKKLAGADIDPIRFEKARQAKILNIWAESASRISARLANGDSPENADLCFYLSGEFLNKIIRQYDSTSGWLDPATSYIVRKAALKLQNGCAIASVEMTAHNESFGVDVDLTMDCIAAMEQSGSDITIKLEPFNISPVVKTGALLSSGEIIENLIKINLGNLSKSFPPLKIPVDFTNNFDVPESKVYIRDKVNMNIISPRRNIGFGMKLKEILIFEDKALVALNLANVEVK